MKDINDFNIIKDPIGNPDLRSENVFEESTTPVVERLEQMNQSSFENFTLEWAYATHTDKFPNGVYKFAGTGDKGRDIVCFLDDPKSENPRWINYQCKYYSNPIDPATVYSEIAKIAYYSFKKDFNPPQEYYFVAKCGVSGNVLDLLNDSKKLKDKFLQAWAKNKKVGKNEDSRLAGDFKKYLESNFDFSIFSHISQMKMIDDHSKTYYHVLRFGRGAKVKRPVFIPPSEEIDNDEHQLKYIRELLVAYGEKQKTSIDSLKVLEKFDQLYDHFKYQRILFHHANQLKHFGKETYPPNADYDDLLEQIFDGIKETIEMDHENGYQKLLKVLEKASSLPIDSHILKENIKVRDKKGICHQLTNDGKFKWSPKK